MGKTDYFMLSLGLIFSLFCGLLLMYSDYAEFSIFFAGLAVYFLVVMEQEN